MTSLSRRSMLTLTAAATAGALIPAPVLASGYQARLIRVKKRPEAPRFAMTGLDGKFYMLKDFRGKVVVLNFWATWCPPCRSEMPSIESLWNKVKDKSIAVIGLHVGPSRRAAMAFARKNGLTFPILVDSDRDVSAHYGVRSMPTTVIIGPEGRVEYAAFGPRTWDSEETIAALEALLRDKPLKT